MTSSAADPLPTVYQARMFLTRLVEIPISQIVITGDPATERNADLAEFHEVTQLPGEGRRTVIRKHNLLAAVRLLHTIESERDTADLAEVAAMLATAAAASAARHSRPPP